MKFIFRIQDVKNVKDISKNNSTIIIKVINLNEKVSHKKYLIYQWRVIFVHETKTQNKYGNIINLYLTDLGKN